jgi:hypothetical protein
MGWMGPRTTSSDIFANINQDVSNFCTIICSEILPTCPQQHLVATEQHKCCTWFSLGSSVSEPAQPLLFQWLCDAVCGVQVFFLPELAAA